MTSRLPALALVLALGFTAVACDDDNPVGPSNEDIRFTAALLASNEVPAVTNAESTATGTMTATLKVTKDAGGTITAATMDFTVTLAGLQPTTSLSAAHIHPGTAGTTGAFIINLNLVSTDAPVSATGTASFTKNAIVVDPTQAAGVIANPAAFYFNVHSTANGGGVARGQLVKQ
jgi:hypothetical protein